VQGRPSVRILIRENRAKDLLLMAHHGQRQRMTPEERQRALDPFYTTKKVRRVAWVSRCSPKRRERAGGRMTLRSKPGMGTGGHAGFGLSHIDRQPMGDIASSLIAIIVGEPWKRFYLPTRGGRQDLPARHEATQKSVGGCAA